MSVEFHAPRGVAWALAGLLVTSACAMSPDRLPPLERRFYTLLDTPGEQRAYLAMKDQERDAFLKQRGWTEAWQSLTQAERDGVRADRVEVGFSEFAAHLAWGMPADRRVLRTRGREIVLETFIRCTSGPKVHQFVRENTECDGTSTELQLALEGGVVTEVKHLD